jgi:LL-diaminopimelate aminotransferase
VKDLRAHRLFRIPPYLFAELDALKSRTSGDVIDFGMGDPDQPTPQPIVQAMIRALADPANHRYPTYSGLLAARTAAAQWYEKRFGVHLNPETEVCMLLGSKEGIGHLLWGLVCAGDAVGIPDPSYMVYKHQTIFAGARPVMMPLLAENRFLVDFDDLRNQPRLKLLILNYPSNPTTAAAPREHYEEAVRLAHRDGYYLLNDNVYSELYYEEKPLSLLQIPGARDVAVEFHSLSKTFNMTGWRIGFVVGNPQMIQAMLAIKQNTDSGPFQAIQHAAIYALKHGDRFAAANRRLYRERRDVLVKGLNALGWNVPLPRATFYVWAQIPTEFGSSGVRRTNSSTHQLMNSLDFCKVLLSRCRILVTPGAGMGKHGEGFVRFALTVPKERIVEAVARMAKSGGIDDSRL